MWLRHWKLREDPFTDRQVGFLPLATHREAVARLVHQIDSGERVVSLRAPEGHGTTTVLVEALRRLRSPGRRIALASGPGEEAGLARALLEGLRLPGDSLRDLAAAARLARIENRAIVLAVDGDGDLADPSWSRRLARIDPHPGSKITVVASGPPREERVREWSLALELPPLTLSESRELIGGRMAWAGGDCGAFAVGAIEAIHHVATGRPKGLVRLARLALMAGAGQGMGRVSSELIGEIAGELAGGIGTPLGGAGGLVLKSSHAISRPVLSG